MITKLDLAINSARTLAGMFTEFTQLGDALDGLRDMDKKSSKLEQDIGTQEIKKKALETDVTSLKIQRNDLDAVNARAIAAAKGKAAALIENAQLTAQDEKTVEYKKLKDLKGAVVLERNKHDALMKTMDEKEAKLSQNITNLEKKMLNILDKFSV